MTRLAPALAFLCGCSLLTVSGPHAEAPPAASPPCTSSNAAPIADVVLAVLSGALVAVSAASATENPDSSSSGIGRGVGAAGLAISIPLTGLFLTSAAFGFHRVARCRATM